MTPFQRMEAHKDNFTPNDLIIYQSILGNPDQVIYKTTSRLHGGVRSSSAIFSQRTL